MFVEVDVKNISILLLFIFSLVSIIYRIPIFIQHIISPASQDIETNDNFFTLLLVSSIRLHPLKYLMPNITKIS
ncbi:hypothetical protein DSM107003_08920 [Trichormus variabilis SAG 1403-4b]|uniref:Uncharacterized protein n=1 Tax=Trichormus variabilis SAG 1403-4b TaxID=447716 RepID=A0A3S1AE92_ANAVA|nr:hypothetical protein DSM107003_08920 [Trichormus variabilis SAG 1403-4b]